MDLRRWSELGACRQTAGTEGRRTAVPTHLGAKQQKPKGGSWSGLRRGNCPPGISNLPGLSLTACAKSSLAFRQKFLFFFFLKVKSSTQIHKSQLWHPCAWCVFCQQRCLCTAHGDTSVFSSPASFSTSVVVPQQPDAFSFSLPNTAPTQILQQFNSFLIFVMS